MKHTKGEWKCSSSGHPDFDHCVIANDGGSVCFVSRWTDAEANAKLIAESPNLLRVLEEIVECQFDNSKPLANLNGLISNAREAIKKATS